MNTPNHAPERDGMLRMRRLGAPFRLEVRTDSGGWPCRIREHRKPFRQILGIREYWRIDDEWWRTPISRWYAVVVLEDGRSLTLYRDLRSGFWYGQPG